MRGLVIIWENEQSEARHRLVCEMALTQLALGGAATIFIRGFVTLQSLNMITAQVLDAGGKVVVCQTMLAERELELQDFDPRIQAGGLVSVMQALGDDRLVVI